jgi:hypothetical protein
MTKTSRKTSRKPHAKTTKDPRFNGMASFVSLRCLPPTVRLTQSLSNNKLRLLFGFFNAHPLNQASLFRNFALKKPLNFVERLCSETGI